MRLDDVRAGGKSALARALALLEANPDAAADLLDAAYADPRAHVVGLTGPPGVGKSTLAAALVRAWRERGLRVGVVAVDPSSRRTKGALLGDRTRIEVDPEDTGVFVRSMAARERMGGLADAAVNAVVLMRALFDRVLIETVGVGQSETDVQDLADTVVLAIQPASGDSLQYMKAGIVEVPDLAVVTKDDLGAVAERAARDLESALKIHGQATDRAMSPAVLRVAAPEGRGIDALRERLDTHFEALKPTLSGRRADQARVWSGWSIQAEWGRRGLAAVAPILAADEPASPFARLRRAREMLG